MKSRFTWTVPIAVVLVVGVAAFKYPFAGKPALSQASPGPVLTSSPSASLPAQAGPTSVPTPTPQPLIGFCVNVPVLLYHHIQPQADTESKGQKNISVDNGIFDKQMEYLKNSGYTTLTSDQLSTALINKQKFPAKSIVLTYDDGYDDFYTYAYPVMQKYGLIANLMIPTGLMDNAGYLSWNQLKEMQGSGLVFSYDHTWSHASLAGKTLEKISFEVLTSKKQLENNLGKPVDIFTYPYGSESQSVIDFLKSNGFIAAFSTLPGHTQCDSFIMTLHRNRVGNTSLSSYGL